ncbi:MAG: phosphoribosylglycinamide formyltransferase [Ignavibacteriae bacterium HGW-Ignavibacteriae-3]|nr:MAG: phosphoribosylglycinamide formyltransferase [Ignavibacteriae bacterium HGW-Ignavibacteriae-3]
MLNTVFFVSGKGSNLKSCYEKFPKDKIRICAVVSNKKCGAVQFAVQNEIPVFLVSSENQTGFFNYEELIRQLKKIPAELIVLAGFLKLIPDNFVDEFESRIINIHPALLPSFGGEGMYGMNVHKAVFDSSAKISGATVHFVDKIYDHGKIIAQKSVDISNVGGPEEIAERVLDIEHELLPFVIQKFAEKKIVINHNRVLIAE